MSAPERDELPDVYCPSCDNEQAKNNLVDESFGHEFGTEERWDTEEYCDACGEPTWPSREDWDDEKDEYLEAERIRKEKRAERRKLQTMTHHDILMIMSRIYKSTKSSIEKYMDCKSVHVALAARAEVYRDVVSDLGICSHAEFSEFMRNLDKEPTK